MMAATLDDDEFRLLCKNKYLVLQKNKLLILDGNPRRWWFRPCWQNRATESEFYSSALFMLHKDPEQFLRYYRMMPSSSERLHALLETKFTKQYVVREPISLQAWLAITLRYLTSGTSMQDLALQLKVGVSTVACHCWHVTEGGVSTVACQQRA